VRVRMLVVISARQVRVSSSRFVQVITFNKYFLFGLVQLFVMGA
jgi:hypothetical protein